MSLQEYLPYLAVGMVVWSLISSLMIEGCAVFIAAEGAIKQMPAPLSIQVFRLLLRSAMIFAHNFVIIIAILVIFQINPGFYMIQAALGLVLILLNGFGFAIFLGTLSARFRDIPPLMASLVQTLFFITPVLWRAESLGDRGAIAAYNPLYYLLELVRAPLLGVPAPAHAWAVGIAFTAANFLVAVLLYARFRWRIPYWV